MTSSWTALLSCLLLASQGWADMGEIQKMVEEMRGEMKEMMEKVEKGDVMREEMREEMQEKDNEMKEVKKQLDMLESRNVELTTQLKEVDQKSLRDLPYVLTCAYQHDWTTPDATITYNSLGADFNNSDKPGGGDGDMNISTGKFTALTAGHYTVTYSGLAGFYPHEQVLFKLYHNGQSAGDEGQWVTHSSGTGGGLAVDQGARTLVSF